MIVMKERFTNKTNKLNKNAGNGFKYLQASFFKPFNEDC
jgi:hypothetical protein